MVSFAVRMLLIAAGGVTSWFVGKDAPGYGVVQMMVATLMLALVVAVIAFWPARWSHVLDRLHKSRDGMEA